MEAVEHKEGREGGGGGRDDEAGRSKQKRDEEIN